MRCQVFMLIGWWHLPPSPSALPLVLLLFVSHLLEAMVEAAAGLSLQWPPPGKQAAAIGLHPSLLPQLQRRPTAMSA